MYHADVSTFITAAVAVENAIADLQASDEPMRQALHSEPTVGGIDGLGADYQAKLREIVATLSYARGWLERVGYTLTE